MAARLNTTKRVGLVPTIMLCGRPPSPNSNSTLLSKFGTAVTPALGFVHTNFGSFSRVLFSSKEPLRDALSQSVASFRKQTYTDWLQLVD